MINHLEENRQEEKSFTASYEVPYEPGTLKAVAYQKDRKLGEYELSTAKSVTKLKVCRVTENERNIAYIKIWLVDDNGTINSQEAEKDCFMPVLQEMVCWKDLVQLILLVRRTIFLIQ